MSQDRNHLNHATWECKYHVVFTPKYRKKPLFGQFGGTEHAVHELARRRDPKSKKDRDFLETNFGQGCFGFHRGAGAGIVLHQKSGNGGQAVGSVATEARDLIEFLLIVPDFFLTASGGSP